MYFRLLKTFLKFKRKSYYSLIEMTNPSIENKLYTICLCNTPIYKQEKCIQCKHYKL